MARQKMSGEGLEGWRWQDDKVREEEMERMVKKK